MPRKTQLPAEGAGSRSKRHKEEQNTALAIISVLRTLHGDIHHAIHQTEMLDMKVSELSGKVDTLINTAMDIKAQVGNAGGNTQDDPQVQEIADRIDRAVDELRGLAVPGSEPITTPPNPNPVPQPGQIDPATGLPVPQPVDPNAPLV